jgi:hypothetical protein
MGIYKPARKVIELTKSDFFSKIANPPFNFFFFSEGNNFFLIGFSFAWLIGPGIFRGNCPLNKWLVMGIYKPPSMSDNDFSTLFIKNIDQCIINYDNIIAMGDLNFDMLNYNFCKLLFFFSGLGRPILL